MPKPLKIRFIKNLKIFYKILFKFIRELNDDNITQNYNLNNIKRLVYNNSDKCLLKKLNKLKLNDFNNDNYII